MEEEGRWEGTKIPSRKNVYCGLRRVLRATLQRCSLPVLPLCHQAVQKRRFPPRPGPPSHTPVTIHPLGHSRNVCTWICSVGTCHLCRGGFPKRRARRAGAAPRLNSGWRVVRHLPGLRDDSQVSWKVTETFIIWWAQEGGLFSPEPGIPSSRWFADPACNVPQREIHHCYYTQSLVAYNTIIPTRFFFPETLKLSLNTSF